VARPRKLVRDEKYFAMRREKTRLWKEKFPDKVSLSGRKYELKKKYGLSYDVYLEMVDSQNGKCALCETECQLVVDHCHETSKIRKLLCRMCNTGLGMFKDNPKVLYKAAKYLET